MMSETFDVVVCGSGPSGLSAALAAAQRADTRVLLVEQMPRLGVKLCASGGTRCNLSNVLEKKEFMDAFGRSGRFMADALSFAPREWLLDFLAKHGVPTVATDEFHYFPSSGKSEDILNAFVLELRRLGVEIRTESKLESLVVQDGLLRGVQVNGQPIFCAALVLACGGTAMWKLGGTNAGMELAKSVGHSIVKPIPAMAGIYLNEEWVKELSGVSLPNVELSFSAGRNSARSRGELLFTFDGISGPAAIDLSGRAGKVFHEQGSLRLSLRMMGGLDAGFWATALAASRTMEPKKLLRTVLAKHFPRSLAAQIMKTLGFSEQSMQELTKSQLDLLAGYLGGAPLTMSRLSPMEKAMAMKGGVSLKEVDPKRMASRILPGLYFAGELLDLDGPCGGFNIQFAFSSGRLAGYAAGHQALEESEGD